MFTSTNKIIEAIDKLKAIEVIQLCNNHPIIIKSVRECFYKHTNKVSIIYLQPYNKQYKGNKLISKSRQIKAHETKISRRYIFTLSSHIRKHLRFHSKFT